MSTPNAAVQLMKGNLERHPDKVAYVCGDQTLTFRQLDLASRRFARLLQTRGIVPGERVVIALPDCFAFPVAFLGCLLAGAIAVTAGSSQRDEDLTHIVNDSAASLLVSHVKQSSLHATLCRGIKRIICDVLGPTEDDACHAADNTPYQPTADDFAYMLYSSGSTGRPKGIPHRHKSLLLPCQLVGQAVLGITGDDIIFSTSKLSFCYGLINSLSFPLHFGATAILLPDKPDARSVLDIIEIHKPSIFFSVPAVFRHIALSSAGPQLKLPLRMCCSAGEALPLSLFKEWQRLTGLEIIDGIGASELAYHFISNRPGQALAGSTGRLVPGYRVRLVDDSGNDVPSGSEGNLLVSGETGAPFYWNLPERSRATMLADGYIRTGDIFLEREGYYYYRGRSDDMIKVDAQWVSPVTVEEALCSHHAVAECAVAAVTVGGFPRPGAFVVLSPGVDQTPDLAGALMKHAKSLLPDHLCPARIRFMTELPRTSTGKIKRSALCEHTPG
ncbi:MAG: benzoate-CoA ligase family protein [Desulfuromonadales bacterium]|nr:benzoate-CoA ligase family protein [Desulfuromonadales bacterium]